jgi:biopolymer transport protein ExbB/TolQ
VVLKYGEHRKQERMFSSDILTKLPQAISPAAAREWVEEFQPRATQKRLFFAPHRISRLLAHFGQHCNRSDLSALLVSQSDIDVSTVNSSYSTLRVFIWAIPIVGFIGTVIGIGDAISGFAELNDPNQLQEQLRPITSGLAGAFETTLIALLFSIVLMFPTSWCQKIELRLLNRLDDFCNEQLLHRLRVDEIGPGKEGIVNVAQEMGDKFASTLHDSISQITKEQNALIQTLDKTVTQQLAAMSTLAAKFQSASKAADSERIELGNLPNNIAEKLAPLINEVSNDIKAAYEKGLTEDMAALRGSVESTEVAIGKLQTLTGQLVEGLNQASTDVTEWVSEARIAAATVSANLSDAKDGVTVTSDRIRKSMEKSVDQLVAVLEQSSTTLADSVNALNRATDSIGQLATDTDTRRKLDSAIKLINSAVPIGSGETEDDE